MKKPSFKTLDKSIAKETPAVQERIKRNGDKMATRNSKSKAAARAVAPDSTKSLVRKPAVPASIATMNRTTAENGTKTAKRPSVNQLIERLPLKAQKDVHAKARKINKVRAAARKLDSNVDS